jgi:hypothetical protein
VSLLTPVTDRLVDRTLVASHVSPSHTSHAHHANTAHWHTKAMNAFISALPIHTSNVGSEHGSLEDISSSSVRFEGSNTFEYVHQKGPSHEPGTRPQVQF